MLVYRLCNEEEYQELINTKSFDNIGKKCSRNKKYNNHKYKQDQKYLHFFEAFDDIFNLYLKKGTYLCIYDIPDEVLEKYKGIGRYLDKLFLRKLELVTEYAIPNEELSFNQIERIERIIKTIDFEDYIDSGIENSFETVYKKEKKQKKK